MMEMRKGNLNLAGEDVINAKEQREGKVIYRK